MRNLGIVALCAALGGCVSTGETVAFRASNPQQQAMMRDGQPALVSRQKNSLVLVRPASREVRTNGRPVFVVGINNFGKQPVDFRVSEVDARQHVGASDYGMQVVTFEKLVQEEKNRQVAAAILTGVAGAANPTAPLAPAKALHDAERSNRNVLQPDRRRHRAEQRRDAERTMFAATVETGQRNMATLEQSVIKDNTLMPGEWYGGQLHLRRRRISRDRAEDVHDRYHRRQRPACD
jgi:hypothetical protein